MFGIRVICCSMFVFCCILNAVSAEVINESIVSILIASTKLEKKQYADAECFNDILSILNNVQNSNLSATWILDSMQFPSGVLYGLQYQLGNYDECMKAELRTQYCLVDLKLTNVYPKHRKYHDKTVTVNNYINTLTKHGRPLNTITWCVCAPASCSEHSVSTFTKVLFKASSLGSIFLEPNIHVDHCQVAGDTKEIGVGVYIFLYLLLTMLLVAIISTLYLSSTNYRSLDSLSTRIASSFCMNKNAYDLVKPSSEDIPALHGMRAITAIIFVYSHQIFFVNSGAVGNGLDVDKFIDDAFFLMHTDLMTDTFLLMSGLLLARGLTAKEKLENPFLVLWKRYIRLIGPMALIVFYVATVSTYAGDGPLWPKLAGTEANMCRKSWWLSLLMLNNYVNSEEMCLITLWYIPADFQLTMLGIFLIYLYRYRQRAGLVAIGVAATLSVVLPAYTTFVRKLPGTILYNVETMANIRHNEVFNSTYIKSHYRMGSYFVGLCLGYIMTLYKPNLHRNTITKNTSIMLFAILFVIAWVPWVIGGMLYTREYNAVEAAMFAASHRIVWVLALSGLVLICEYGELPIVPDLLSWHAWVPLSRLSYGLYLIHPVIIQYNVFSTRHPLRHHPFTMLSDSFGPVVLGYLLSLVMWFLLQAPISNLANLIHSRRKSLQAEASRSTTSEKKYL